MLEIFKGWLSRITPPGKKDQKGGEPERFIEEVVKNIRSGFLDVWGSLENQGENKEGENAIRSLFNNVLCFINLLKPPENNHQTTVNFFLTKIDDTASFYYWKPGEEIKEKGRISFSHQVFPEDFWLLYYPSSKLGEIVEISIINPPHINILSIARSFENGKVYLSATGKKIQLEKENFLLIEDWQD